MNKEARLLSALKEVHALYTQFWDMTDGGLVVLPPSLPRFEKAFWEARVAIAHAEGEKECICYWEDDRHPTAEEERTRICSQCELPIIV